MTTVTLTDAELSALEVAIGARLSTLDLIRDEAAVAAVAVLEGVFRKLEAGRGVGEWPQYARWVTEGRSHSPETEEPPPILLASFDPVAASPAALRQFNEDHRVYHQRHGVACDPSSCIFVVGPQPGARQ